MTPAELTEQRERLGLKKAELARELKVKWLTIHRWERGIYPVPRWAIAFLVNLKKGNEK